MLTMRQVEAFRAVMATGTATEAARVLGITQPAVSRMLADLEASTQLRLFERINRKLMPTAEAHLLFDEVEHAFMGLEQIGLAATSIRNFARGRLRIIAIPGLVSTLIANTLVGFLRKYPGIVTSLEVQPSQYLFEWLIGRQCDIAISTLPIYNATLDTEVVSVADAVCILPPGHPLARKKLIKARDLESTNIISFKSDTMFQYTVDEAFRREGVECRVNIEVRSTEAVYRLVAAGMGAAIVPPRFLASYGVETRAFAPRIEVPLVVMTPNDRAIPRVAVQFKRFLVETQSTRAEAAAK